MQHPDFTRADAVFGAIDAVTLGGLTARLRSAEAFQNARRTWADALNRLDDRQYANLLRRLPMEVRRLPTLGEVLTLGHSEFDGCL